MSVADLIPGLAFREACPFFNRDVWSPIQPLRLKHPPDHDKLISAPLKVPRKADRELAQWLLDCLRRTLSDTAVAEPLTILVIGDGEGDVRLTRRLNELSQGQDTVHCLLYGAMAETG